MDSPVQSEPDQIEPGTLPEQPKPLAMPVWIYRLIGINACVMYLLMLSAFVFGILISDQQELSTGVMLVSGAVYCLALILIFIIARSYFVPSTRRVVWVTVLPVVWMAIALPLSIFTYESVAQTINQAFWILLILVLSAFIGLMLFCYPLVVVHGAIGRFYKKQSPRYPRGFSGAERKDAVFFVCTVFGSAFAFWCILLNSAYVAIWVDYPVITLNLSEVFSFTLLASIGGVGRGLILSAIVVPLMCHTDLYRSVVYVFRWPIILGLLCSIFSPGWAVIISGASLVFFAAISKSKFKLHPLGHCQYCGYSLAGLETNMCPECGQIDKQQQHLVRG